MLLQQRRVLPLPGVLVHKPRDRLYSVMGGVRGGGFYGDRVFRGDLRGVREREPGDYHRGSGEC